MTSPNSAEFSFDTYDNLDQQLKNAFYKRVNASSPGAAPNPTRPPEYLTSAIDAWARHDIQVSLSLWDIHLRGPDVPSYYELKTLNPNFSQTVQRLYNARQDLVKSDEATPTGQNIGESMKLLTIPWKAFQSELYTLDTLLRDWREMQAPDANPDFISNALTDAILLEHHIYHHDQTIVSARDYLNHRIAQDGPWGVALVQTSEIAGLQNMEGMSFPENNQLMLAGHNVGAMGLFEWIAFTFYTHHRFLAEICHLPATQTQGAFRFTAAGRWNPEENRFEIDTRIPNRGLVRLTIL